MARYKRPKTAEEIRKQKRECERKRRARIKANPDLYEAYKKKDNLRYTEKRRKKQIKLVSEMTPRERRAKQCEWRERKARSRQNKKRNERLLQSLRENTPDSIAGDQNPDSQQNVFNLSPASSTASTVFRRSSLINPRSSFSREECPTPSSSSSNLNRQKVAGIRLAGKRREESNLKINTQATVIQTLEKKVHALRVQLLRANHKIQQLSSHPKKVAKQILTKKLKPLNSKIIAFLERDDNKLCKSIVCDINKEACMLRKCRVCLHKSPEIQLFDGSETTTFKTWCVTKEKRLIKGQEKEIRRTVNGQKKEHSFIGQLRKKS
ncbi:hypothetical protein HF086_018230 [Spodoptera exigua]|uniref:Uncharacterized protein n=1 Tax=Spodoptera exigua TaxID=7107 RepID=A0A922MWL9_SPOEX|nr:hypothetical protein HF086_018230 [Spodoptera exigua]